MTCPTCGHHTRQPFDGEIVLPCQLCGRPFGAREILQLCPACAQSTGTSIDQNRMRAGVSGA